MVYMDRPKTTRDRMSISDRAAQFAPFSALTGHKDVIDETARFVDEKIVLCEDKIEELSYRFGIILKNIDSKPEVTIEYFIKDEFKNGGRYERVKTRIKKYNEYESVIILEDGTEVSIDDIIDIV